MSLVVEKFHRAAFRRFRVFRGKRGLSEELQPAGGFFLREEVFLEVGDLLQEILVEAMVGDGAVDQAGEGAGIVRFEIAKVVVTEHPDIPFDLAGEHWGAENEGLGHCIRATVAV